MSKLRCLIVLAAIFGFSLTGNVCADQSDETSSFVVASEAASPGTAAKKPIKKPRPKKPKEPRGPKPRPVNPTPEPVNPTPKPMNPLPTT